MDFILNSFDFTQHIARPTHNHGNTLDLVISKGVDIFYTTLSDNYCLFFDVIIDGTRKNGTEYLIKKAIYVHPQLPSSVLTL